MVPRNGASAQQLPKPCPAVHDHADVPRGGGTQSVFIDRTTDCPVTESPPAGCKLTSIDPGTTQIRNPILYSATVTNNCDPPPQPAWLRAAVVEAPRFTG